MILFMFMLYMVGVIYRRLQVFSCPVSCKMGITPRISNLLLWKCWSKGCIN